MTVTCADVSDQPGGAGSSAPDRRARFDYVYEACYPDDNDFQERHGVED